MVYFNILVFLSLPFFLNSFSLCYELHYTRQQQPLQQHQQQFRNKRQIHFPRSSEGEVDNEFRCVFLRECPQLQFLLGNLDKTIQGFKVHKNFVLGHARNHHCGFEDGQLKVKCPLGEEIISTSDYEDEFSAQGEFTTTTTTTTTTEDSIEHIDFGTRSGLIDNLPKKFHCSGTLIVFHLPQDLRGYSNEPAGNTLFNELKIMSLLGGPEKKFPKLGDTKLADRHVEHLSADGNCCWKIYSKTSFRGDSQKIGVGFEGKPCFSFKSVKTMEC